MCAVCAVSIVLTAALCVCVRLDDEREIRIFLSSPFKDMQKERDAVVRTIIPKLRKICTERDVLITCIDLRWYVPALCTRACRAFHAQVAGSKS